MFVEQVYAQTSVNVPTLANFTSVGNIFAFVINIILGVGWALVFVMLALGIIQYIMSKGDSKATGAAREWLTAAAIGGVALFFLTTLRVILFNLVGIQNNTIGNSQVSPFQ